MRRSTALRRVLATCLCLGLVLMAVEPDTSMLFGGRGQQRSVAGASGDAAGAAWAAWCLIGAACCVLSLCAVVVRRSALLRTLAGTL